MSEHILHLVDIDSGNWRTPLKVSKSQEGFVANSTTILARAYAYRNAGSRAMIIYASDIPVGMVLYYYEESVDAYIFSELFIDERYQGRGYGRAATGLVLDMMKQEGKYGKVMLCYIEGNIAAQKLYEGFGFVETDRDGDEIIMELAL